MFGLVSFCSRILSNLGNPFQLPTIVTDVETLHQFLKLNRMEHAPLYISMQLEAKIVKFLKDLLLHISFKSVYLFLLRFHFIVTFISQI